VNQGCRLESVAGLFVGQPDDLKLAQLVVGQRKEFGRGRGVAGLKSTTHTDPVEVAADKQSARDVHCDRQATVINRKEQRTRFEGWMLAAPGGKW
jgi:hypothetical protein